MVNRPNDDAERHFKNPDLPPEPTEEQPPPQAEDEGEALETLTIEEATLDILNSAIQADGKRMPRYGKGKYPCHIVIYHFK